MRLDASSYQEGVPELVAAELVRNVVEPKEFHEFCQFDCLTVLNGDKYYRIPRRPHGLIEVWDAKTRRALSRLCVVFQDPGMPPSDEVVMKYLLAKHQPDLALEGGRPVQSAHRQIRGHVRPGAGPSTSGEYCGHRTLSLIRASWPRQHRP